MALVWMLPSNISATSVRGCIEALRPTGQYTQVFFKHLSLTGSVCYPAQTWDRRMKTYEQGRVRLNDIISSKLPISEWRTAFDLCAQKRGLNVLMYPEA